MLRVNGTTYDGDLCDALDGSMSISFETEDDIADIVEAFCPEDAPVIEQIEGGEVVGVWYNKEIQRVTISGKGKKRVELLLRVSSAPKSVENDVAELKNDVTALTEALEGLLND